MTKPVTRAMDVNCLLNSINSVFHGLTCGICGEYLMPEQNIQFDHIHADVFDGPHEYKNLRALHTACHKRKSARDVKDNAKIKRILGPRKSKRPMQKSQRKLASRPFNASKRPKVLGLRQR